RMQHEMAYPTAEQQALVRAVVLRGIPAARACLAGLVGVHLHRHAACAQRFVGEIAVWFSKGLLRGMSVGLTLLLTRLLSVPASPPLADMRQVLQSDQAVRVGVHDAPTDDMVALLLQPSLSPAHHHQRWIAERVPLCRKRLRSRA